MDILFNLNLFQHEFSLCTYDYRCFYTIGFMWTVDLSEFYFDKRPEDGNLYKNWWGWRCRGGTFAYCLILWTIYLDLQIYEHSLNSLVVMWWCDLNLLVLRWVNGNRMISPQRCTLLLSVVNLCINQLCIGWNSCWVIISVAIDYFCFSKFPWRPIIFQLAVFSEEFIFYSVMTISSGNGFFGYDVGGLSWFSEIRSMYRGLTK